MLKGLEYLVALGLISNVVCSSETNGCKYLRGRDQVEKSFGLEFELLGVLSQTAWFCKRTFATRGVGGL